MKTSTFTKLDVRVQEDSSIMLYLAEDLQIQMDSEEFIMFLAEGTNALWESKKLQKERQKAIDLKKEKRR